MYDKICCYQHPDAPLVDDYHAGDMICSACGLVVGDRVIDVSCEWRTFTEEVSKSNKNRVGPAENKLLSEGTNLTTIIGPATSKGLLITAEGRPKVGNRSTVSSADGARIRGYKSIDTAAACMNLAEGIIDRAKNMFKKIQDNKALRGHSTDAIVAACLYLSCRQEEVPRTFKEINCVTRTSKKEVGRCFKLILKMMETKVRTITSGDFMSRFCGRLDLPMSVERAATRIAMAAKDKDIVNACSPISVAAAAIYMAASTSGYKKSAKEIGDAAGVAESTIRKAYGLMMPHAAILFPSVL